MCICIFFCCPTGSRVDRRLMANVPARTCMRIQHATAHAGCEQPLHTTTRGPRDPTPRTRQAGPPTTLALATQRNLRVDFSSLSTSVEAAISTGTTGPAESSAAGPHIPMVGNHGDIFLPPDPVDRGWGGGWFFDKTSKSQLIIFFTNQVAVRDLKVSVPPKFMSLRRASFPTGPKSYIY